MAHGMGHQEELHLAIGLLTKLNLQMKLLIRSWMSVWDLLELLNQMSVVIDNEKCSQVSLTGCIEFMHDVFGH